jgi:hypothetical protein
VSLEQARAELSAIARRVKAEHGDGTWMFDAPSIRYATCS